MGCPEAKPKAGLDCYGIVAKFIVTALWPQYWT
jgi:hypothetical protein